MRTGQASTRVVAIEDSSASSIAWVAKTTPTLALRSVFSHSRSCAAKIG
jgi:hypothetical protein